MTLRFGLPIVACCVLMAGVFVGCDVEEDAISPPPEEIEERDDPEEIVEGFHIEQPRVRVAPEGGTTAAYMVIRNSEADADTLQSAQSDAAQDVEIHESYEQEDGTVGMREVESIAIDAHSEVILEPGGIHLMLLDLTRGLEAGETVQIDLEFTRRGTETYSFTVEDLEVDPTAEEEGQ